MTKRRSNPDFLNGVPELLVLQLLSRRPMYGYELVQAIQRDSKDLLTFGEGCIYPVLHRLEQEGHLASRRQVVTGRSRVVYRATRSGHRKLAKSVALWHGIVRAVNGILQGGEHEQAAIA